MAGFPEVHFNIVKSRVHCVSNSVSGLYKEKEDSSQGVSDFMVLDIETITYLLAGIIVTGLYIKRQKEWAKFNEDVIPEIDKKVFYELKGLLKKSYQRGLYLGLSFLYLAYITYMRGMPQAKIFGIILTLGLFFYNIPPRNKIMKILTATEIDLKTLSQRGVKL